MRLFYWLYMNLKLIFKQFPITILYMIGFPLFIGLLMGNVSDIMFENPNAVNPLRLEVIDQDQSDFSKQLIDFLNNEELTPYFVVTDESIHATLTIPSGYEQQLLNQRAGNLLLSEVNLDNVTISLEAAQRFLNQYHENLMLNLSTNSSDVLSLIYEQTSLQSQYLETPLGLNSVTFYSVGMMSFFIFMMIMTVTASGYKSSELGLDKRYYSAPITRLRMFNYDFLANFIYCLILLMIYVLVYRLIGYSFTGPLWLLIPPVFVSAFFIVSIGSFIGSFFSAKYGNLAANVIFFIQIFIGGSFFPSEELSKFSPSYFITQMFQNYILQGTWESIQKPFFITLGIAFVFYGLTCLKEKFRFWEV